MDSGQVNTLVSSDAEQADLVWHFLHYLWVCLDTCLGFILLPSQIAPLELGAAAIVFWYFVNYLSLIAVFYTILLICCQLGFGEIVVFFR
jgi:hypothetical protein